MRFMLPSLIGYGRLESILKILSEFQRRPGQLIELDWGRVRKITPAGYGMLACLFDSAVEHQCTIRNVSVMKHLKQLAAVRNLSEVSTYKTLPMPQIHNSTLETSMLVGQAQSLNMTFVEDFEIRFGDLLSEDLAFSCRLILNELMQNSIDHSGSDRYYLYAGKWDTQWKTEIQIGVMDMGVTIPAKLQQKYQSENDAGFLELALREGITTRRIRPGGLGLFYTFEHLKNHNGTLTIVSRNSQLIRYFKNKKIRRQLIKTPLRGSWCMARFPIVGKK